MNRILKKIKTYARLCLVVAVALAVVLIIFKNYGRKASFWFFQDFENVSVLWLIACTAAGSIVAYWVSLTVWSLWRDLREMHRDSETAKAHDDQRKREAALEEQERRIDEKRAELLREDDGNPPS
jgi:type VI protein secretion system component VasK